VQGSRCVKKYTPSAPPPTRTASRSFCTPGLLMSMLAMVRRLLVGALIRGHLTADLELHDVLVAGLAALGHGELDVREQRRTLDPRHEVRHDQVGISDPLQLQVVARILRDPGQPEVVWNAPSQLVHEPNAQGAPLFELRDDAHTQVELRA